MKKSFTLSLLVFLTSIFVITAQAHENPYWEDSADNIVRSGSGGCWRTLYWSMDKALPECEGGTKKVATVMDADKDGVVDGEDKCPGTAKGINVDATGCPADSDGDGAADSYDRCPGTPKGIKVDATGCPLDSDGDGAADSYDRCPGTPKGINVDATGCPADSDNDGAADSYDRCPGTPRGVEVDAQGCPVSMDDDDDGIVNANDDCPGSAAGVAVNKRGCELKANLALNNVLFDTGTANLDSRSTQILDRVAQTLKENPHLKFEVAGHTDNTGSYQTNINLSQQRAQSVRQYLINQGVAASNLTARGYGPDKPMVSNRTRAGRSVNRRVELVLQ